MSSDWSALPLSPLKLILQQLPLEERMQSCALVSSSWADAAIAATVDLTSEQLELDSSRRAKACHSWCIKHHAYAKNVSYYMMRVMSSPLDHKHLRALSISTTWTVRLAPFGQWRGLLQDATALTSLKLKNTSVYGWPAAAAQLTSLKRLDISSVKSKDPGDPHIPGTHLSLLQQLTYLQLKDEDAVAAAALQQLSRLSNLQELRLASAVWADEEDVDVMQLSAVNSSIARLQCLTALNMDCISPVPVGIFKLTALEELRIDWCSRVDPECLAGGINLRSLTFNSSAGSREGAQAQLLQHLGHMRHLTFLDLTGSLSDDWEGVPLSALAGITASSSSLQHLKLSDCSLPLRGDTWRSVFRQDGQQLTALTYLTLQEASPELAGSDIKRLVQACPNLRSLNLRDALQAKVSLLPLTRLSALTELDISRVTTESAVRVLAQLSGLRELRVRQPSEVSRVSRLHLTALKQLRELLLPLCRDAAPKEYDDDEFYWLCCCQKEAFSNKGPDSVPDVWAQLLVDCNKHMRLPAAQQAEARQAAHKFKLR